MPADTRGSVRQRKTAPIRPSTEEPTPQVEIVELNSSDDEDDHNGPLQEDPKPKPSVKTRVKKEDNDYSPWVDVLRVITLLLLASTALSYLISGGDTYTWGLKRTPKYLNKEYWAEKLRQPISLTPDELKAFDGSDAEKPIYLAINGSVYDVSANRRTYGPGGSYNVFAGVDAARGFVTGCFAEDATADLRGIEEMHIPRDDPEVDRHFTAAELAELKKKELEDAKQKVHDQLSHWVNFFAKSPKYPKIGTVKREKNWLEKEPRKKLCSQAEKGRPKRKIPEAK